MGDDDHRVAVSERSSLFATIGAGRSVRLTTFSVSDDFARVVLDELAPALGATMTGPLRIANGVLQPG